MIARLLRFLRALLSLDAAPQAVQPPPPPPASIRYNPAPPRA